MEVSQVRSDCPKDSLNSPASGGTTPVVRDEDVIQFGQRDAEEAMTNGSQDIRATDIRVLDLSVIWELGIAVAISSCAASLALSIAWEYRLSVVVTLAWRSSP